MYGETFSRMSSKRITVRLLPSSPAPGDDPSHGVDQRRRDMLRARFAQGGTARRFLTIARADEDGSRADGPSEGNVIDLVPDHEGPAEVEAELPRCAEP